MSATTLHRKQRPLPIVGIGTGTVLIAAGGAVALGPKVFALLAGALLAALLLRERTALFTAFLYIGIFKGTGPLASLPADPTLLLGLLLGAVCLYRLLNGRVRVPTLGFAVLLLAIGLLLAVSMLWTPAAAAGYGGQKVAKFWTLTALASLSPFFIFEDRRDLRRFAGWTAVAAAIAAGIALVHPAAQGTGEEGRLVLDTVAGTIFLSRLVCSGALVLLMAAAFLPVGRWRLPLGLAGTGLLIVALGVGSRGPVVSIGLALICLVTIAVVSEPRRLLSLLAVVTASIAILPFVPLPQTSIARVQGVVTNPSGSLSQDSRSGIYGQAIALIKQHPLIGIGSGGFSIYSNVVSRPDFNEQYPHNIFLELWVEIGIVPVLMLAASVVYVLFGLLRRISSYGSDPHRHLIELYLGLLLFNLFAVQFSGDINDNRTFWAALGAGWLLVRFDLAPGTERVRDAGSVGSRWRGVIADQP